MKFTKMHGIGNDYVYVNCFDEQVTDPAAMARVISDRHRGVGSDGLILIRPSDRADVRMEMYNADGSRAQMCGNGIRCVAKYAYEHGLIRRTSRLAPGATPEEMANVVARTELALAWGGGGGAGVPDGGLAQIAPLTVETDAGIKALGLVVFGGRVAFVCVDMGRPSLRPADLPCTLDGDRIVDRAVMIYSRSVQMTCVSVGNPHAIVFVEDVRAVDPAVLGRRIETAPFFPERINVHFVQVNHRDDVTMATWERGSGITLACGTGATAVCVAGAVTGRTNRTIVAHLPGGDLHLNWAEDDHVYMTGPASEVFTGDWPG